MMKRNDQSNPRQWRGTAGNAGAARTCALLAATALMAAVRGTKIHAWRMPDGSLAGGET